METKEPPLEYSFNGPLPPYPTLSRTRSAMAPQSLSAPSSTPPFSLSTSSLAPTSSTTGTGPSASTLGPITTTGQRPPSAIETRFASLTFDKNTLCLTNIPGEEVFSLQHVLERAWPKGIKETKCSNTTITIHFEGHPWHHVKKSAAVIEQKRLGALALQGLFDRGYVACVGPIDPAPRHHGRTAIVLRHQSLLPEPRAWMSISFYEGDTLLLVDAPTAVAQRVVRVLGERVQKNKPVGEASYKIRLKGKPWHAPPDKAEQPRVLRLMLLEVLEQHGYRLYASAPISAAESGNRGRAGDTWICTREARWTEGSPVYWA